MFIRPIVSDDLKRRCLHSDRIALHMLDSVWVGFNLFRRVLIDFGDFGKLTYCGHTKSRKFAEIRNYGNFYSTMKKLPILFILEICKIT